MIECTFGLSEEEVERIVRVILQRHLKWAQENRPIMTHEDDIKDNKKDIKALKRVIDYFGGEIDD